MYLDLIANMQPEENRYSFFFQKMVSWTTVSVSHRSRRSTFFLLCRADSEMLFLCANPQLALHVLINACKLCCVSIMVMAWLVTKWQEHQFQPYRFAGNTNSYYLPKHSPELYSLLLNAITSYVMLTKSISYSHAGMCCRTFHQISSSMSTVQGSICTR